MGGTSNDFQQRVRDMEDKEARKIEREIRELKRHLRAVIADHGTNHIGPHTSCDEAAAYLEFLKRSEK